MNRPPDPRRGTAFGAFAEEYERWRPVYPDAAVDWLKPPGAVRVADVGAGTGKLTGSLVGRGLDVVAVEPDPGMLHVLRRQHPTATALQAGAEHLPLDDASVDAVLVATAWHWFRHAEAVREVRRVLRPGGRLGLVWTGPEPGPGWTGELARLDPDRGATHWQDPARRAVGVPPDELETATIRWGWTVDADAVRGHLGTHSAFAVLDATERERALDAAWAVVDAQVRRVGEPTLVWPQAALCARWTPSARQSARPGA